MNKYLDGAIVLSSICSLSLTSLSVAETEIYEVNELSATHIAVEQDSPTRRWSVSPFRRNVGELHFALRRPHDLVSQPWALRFSSRGAVGQPSNSLVKDIQLEKLNDSLAIDLDIETATNSISKPEPPLVSDIAINLIKEFEGFESQAYIDTDGTPVIGYGLSKIAGKPVKLGDRISPEQADAALKTHLQEINQELAKIVKVKLSEAQKSALASICFNVGINGIKNSTLIKKINNRDFAGAANEFLRWDKANMRGRLVQLPGLTRRRSAERQLFLDPSS